LPAVMAHFVRKNKLVDQAQFWSWRLISTNAVPIFVQWLFLILLVVLLTKTFWIIFTPLDAPKTAPDIISQRAIAYTNTQATASANPFFTMAAVVVENKIVTQEEIVETSLDLTLHGVRLDGENSTAIIDVNIGNNQERGQDVFGINDEVANGVVLVALNRGEAIIERDGVREALRLEGYEPNRRASRPIAPPSSSGHGRAQRRRSGNQKTQTEPLSRTNENELAALERSTDGRADELREIIALRLRALPNGEQGLFLVPGKNREAFAQIGLVAQDRLININGSPVPKQLRRVNAMMAELSNSGTLSILVEREGVPKSIDIVLEARE